MKIAVLSRNPKLYSTSRLVEAIQKRGHQAVVLDHMKCDIIMDNKGPYINYEGEVINDIDAIIPRIGASVTFYGTAVVRQFEMMNVFCVVDSIAITRSRDKLRSLQILSSSGVGMPKTAFTNFNKKENKVLKHIGQAPVVIKLLEGTQGLGVVLAETNKAATSVIEAFESLKTRVILQEFIEEAGGADIRAFIVNGEVVGAMKRQGKEGEFRSNLHRGGEANVIKLSRAEKSTALKAAKSMGLAVAGVDMLQSKNGPLVLEVNSSPGLEGIEKATGIDVAEKIIEYIENSTKKKRVNKKKNA
ncbi:MULTISPECIES: 30S ribosomal protein S6--L-glutamate ligase [Reichenbachiella]|uniref:30S ribosomal protein S6--L-glutamate ligase n=1 Tax=Reichenbachiella TaxID=156993 RepID=UPI000E6D5528|nr:MULTISPECIES: 30S ribosomal protein S6--L-glutamate ligase [Reichenbachiella]MBU2915379.1 30S ribosomal protein S6--L-glutamate ligase [Reichenbachiella agariperforans]RJE71549.1 alpha-L-glutamate ligase [Reichenbachiella sp. MSK19-1]